jgi:hypothetical protein
VSWISSSHLDPQEAYKGGSCPLRTTKQMEGRTLCSKWPLTTTPQLIQADFMKKEKKRSFYLV